MSEPKLKEISAFSPATGSRVILVYPSIETARERNPHLRDFREIRYYKDGTGKENL